MFRVLTPIITSSYNCNYLRNMQSCLRNIMNLIQSHLFGQLLKQYLQSRMFKTQTWSLINLSTPLHRGILHKPAVRHWVKKFTAYCGNQKLIGAFAGVPPFRIILCSSSQFATPQPIPMHNFNQFLGLPNGLLPLGSPTKICWYFSSLSTARRT